MQYGRTVVIVAPPARVEAALRRREEEIGRNACLPLIVVGLLVVEVDEGVRRECGSPRARQAATAADGLGW
jgi:hypothetical protein